MVHKGKPDKFSLQKPLCKTDGCPLKGMKHPKCKAHNRMGKPCGNEQLEGQFVCRMHGGLSQAGLERGKLRQAVSLASRIVAFDYTDEESIEDGLLREVRQSSQTARAYAEVISEMERSLVQRTPKDGEKLDALIQAWSDERIVHARLAKMAIDAGLDKRKLELAENQATQMVQAMVMLLESPILELTRTQQLQGRQAAAEILRSMQTPQIEAAVKKKQDDLPFVEELPVEDEEDYLEGEVVEDE